MLLLTVVGFRQMYRLSQHRILAQVNQQLPDYAQIKAYQLLTQPLSVADGTLTANGRPRRVEVVKKYQSEINDLFVSNDLTGESYEFLSNAG